MIRINGMDGRQRDVDSANIVGLNFGQMVITQAAGWRFLVDCGVTIRGDEFIDTDQAEVTRIARLLGVI